MSEKVITVGDRVRVTGVIPPAEGKVVEVSTWGAIGGSHLGGRCYRVRVDHWSPPERWIDTIFVEVVEVR